MISCLGDRMDLIGLNVAADEDDDDDDELDAEYAGDTPSPQAQQDTNPNPKVRKSGAVGKAVLAQDPGFDGTKSCCF